MRETLKPSDANALAGRQVWGGRSALSVLSKKYRVTKKKDFEKVFKFGYFFSEKFISVKTAENGLPLSRFGFIVSLKVSKKAVIRNKTRRQLQEVIRLHLKDVKRGFDIVVMAKPEIIGKDYWEIEQALLGVLSKAELMA